MAEKESGLGAVLGGLAALLVSFGMIKYFEGRQPAGDGATGYIPPPGGEKEIPYSPFSPEAIKGDEPIGPFEPITPPDNLKPGGEDNPLEPEYPGGGDDFGTKEEAISWGKTLYEQRAKALGWSYDQYLSRFAELNSLSISQMTWQDLYVFDYNGSIFDAKMNERYYDLVYQYGGNETGGIVNPPSSWTGTRSEFRRKMYDEAAAQIRKEGGY